MLSSVERAKFNKELAENPSAFSESDDLYFNLGSLNEGVTFAQENIVLSDSTDIVTYFSKDISLTKLIINLNLSPEFLLKISRKNPNFIRALLSNYTLFSLFSPAQQVELFFIYTELLLSDASFNEALKMPMIHQLLKNIATKYSYESDFSSIAPRYPEGMSKALLVLHDYLKSFSKQNLMKLSTKSLIVMNQVSGTYSCNCCKTIDRHKCQDLSARHLVPTYVPTYVPGTWFLEHFFLSFSLCSGYD